MYRLLALAKYDERYVIPTSYTGPPRTTVPPTDAASTATGAPA